MSGVFSTWQPRYAEKRIATFPVNDDKRPSVRGWNKVGLKGSAKLVAQFPEANALGFQLGHHSRVTVLDVDTHEETVLADALNLHGQTPFIVQTGGGFHAYYGYGGERRRIRPWPDKPIDLLGGGFVVAPPSHSAKGQYKIIKGTLDDLDCLPPIHVVLEASRVSNAPIPIGKRDNALF